MAKKYNLPIKKKKEKADLPKDFGKVILPVIERAIETKKALGEMGKVQPPKKKTGRSVGRPLKISECKDEIIEAFRRGAPMKDAIAGLIHKCTFIDWINKGKEDINNNIQSVYSEFSIKIDIAQKEYRNQLRATIEMHSVKDWKAASWLLERSDPENYTSQQKVDVTSGGEKVQPFFLPLKEEDDE